MEALSQHADEKSAKIFQCYSEWYLITSYSDSPPWRSPASYRVSPIGVLPRNWGSLTDHSNVVQCQPTCIYSEGWEVKKQINPVTDSKIEI